MSSSSSINKKAQQRNQLIMEFGILIQPFVELVESSEPPPISKYRIARAKVQAGDPAWRKSVRLFTTFADDIFMHSEYQKISHVNEFFLRNIRDYLESDIEFNSLQSILVNELEDLRENFFKYLSGVPIDWEPEIFPANTPFTSYLKIKDAISHAEGRIHYFDRYLKVAFYETFLRNVDRDIEIRLVTTPGKRNKDFGVIGVQAISELVRQEFTNYQLVEVSPHEIHDRNLRVDNLMFSLGPGIDRAGLALTNFGPADSSPRAHAQLDSIISSGTIIHQS